MDLLPCRSRATLPTAFITPQPLSPRAPSRTTGNIPPTMRRRTRDAAIWLALWIIERPPEDAILRTDSLRDYDHETPQIDPQSKPVFRDMEERTVAILESGLFPKGMPHHDARDRLQR